MRPDVPLVGPLERTLFLQSLPTFEGLRSSQLASLAQLLREEYVDPGTVLCRQGEPAAAIYILVDGTVENLRDGKLIYEQESPGVCGLSGLLGGRVASLEGRSVTALTTLVVDGDAFLDLIEDHFDMFLHIRTLYAFRVAELQKATRVFHTDYARKFLTDLPEPRGIVESLLCLRRSVVFADASVSALAQMIDEESIVRVAVGESLWREGDVARSLVVVVRGEIECSIGDGSGRFVAGPGYVLGADATFGSLPLAYSATARTPVVALRIDAAALTDVMEDHFDFALDTLAHFAREEIRLRERLASA